MRVILETISDICENLDIFIVKRDRKHFEPDIRFRSPLGTMDSNA